jgi:hypothetical protein
MAMPPQFAKKPAKPGAKAPAAKMCPGCKKPACARAGKCMKAAK